MSTQSSLRTDPATAKERVDRGEAIILDVIQPATWNRLPVAIEGALRIEPNQVPDRFGELPVEKEMIAYCT